MKSKKTKQRVNVCDNRRRFLPCFLSAIRGLSMQAISPACLVYNELTVQGERRHFGNAQIASQMYDLSLLEEELKNKVAADWFADFDATAIIGKIDFAVAVSTPKGQKSLLETEYLLWAEAKKGNKNDIYESFVQLILTIGKARTFDNNLPPAYLGAFDAEKIAFISYHKIVDIFYMNDFNWNVTPSDHTTKEFKLVLDRVTGILDSESLIYKFKSDADELKFFIKNNFIVGKSSTSKIRITKNNFVSIYNKWFAQVRDTINVDWEKSRKAGIIAADFYLADILSENNVSLRDKLFALLKTDHYELDRRIDEGGFIITKSVGFKDNQKAHTQFWNIYERPPKEEYWDYIIERRDLLVPQDIRERKGSYFTPKIWVEKSQEYIADVLGEDWQDEYVVWDCCAGTGNLLAGLTNKYNIWASTLDKQDVEVMKDTMVKNGSLLENHVFQFDFLNDEFTKLPQGLQDIINDEKRRKKLLIYINPPYAEVSSKKSDTDGKKTKTAVNITNIHSKYTNMLGTAGRELFVQFLIRIKSEIPNITIADFSTLKILQGSAFESFRNVFTAKLLSLHLMPAYTFDNVNGKFPIGFFIWNTDKKENFKNILADVYDEKGQLIEKKNIYSLTKKEYINAWISLYKKKIIEKRIGFLDGINSNDFQHNNYVYMVNNKEQIGNPRGLYVDSSNILPCCIYYSVRHVISATWLNDRDQFLYPNDGWKADKEFQSNCLAYTLFNNNIQSQYGTNHWIPFTEKEVNAKDCFESHFMTDFIAGKIKNEKDSSTLDFGEETKKTEKISFTPKAQAVMDAGRELWKYYHSQPNANVNASFYDIKEYFQGRDAKGRMNSSSNNETYNKLLANLRDALKVLAKAIEPKVYEYGFLK